MKSHSKPTLEDRLARKQRVEQKLERRRKMDNPRSTKYLVEDYNVSDSKNRQYATNSN